MCFNFRNVYIHRKCAYKRWRVYEDNIFNGIYHQLYIYDIKNKRCSIFYLKMDKYVIGRDFISDKRTAIY